MPWVPLIVPLRVDAVTQVTSMGVGIHWMVVRAAHVSAPLAAVTRMVSVVVLGVWRVMFLWCGLCGGVGVCCYKGLGVGWWRLVCGV